MGQMHEEGLQDVAEVYLATPGDFYLGLCSDSVIVKGDTFTDLTEVTGSGYARVAMTSFTITTLGTDNRLATGNSVTFNASGNWTEAQQWFLIKDGDTSGTYIVIASNALTGGAVTLVNGESTTVTPKFSLSS